MTADADTTEQTEQTEATEDITETTETTEPADATSNGDRLPDDHPVVKALAKANKEAEQARLKVKEFEDSQKTEQQKLAEALEAAKADSNSSKAEAAKLRAAIKHGLSEEDLELLGDGTPEQIEARAEKLAARIGSSETPVVPVTRRQGSDGDAPSQSPQELADAVVKRRGF